MTRIIRRKTIAVILTLAMTISLLPVLTLSAFASTTTTITGTLLTTNVFYRPKTIADDDGSHYSSTNVYYAYIEGNITGTMEGVGSYNYFTRDFKPSTSGNYTFEVTSITGDDSYVFIYDGTFDPANPLNNLYVCNDDKSVSPANYLSFLPNIPLDATQNYTLVLTTFSYGTTGNLELTIDGPGSVTTSANSHSSDSYEISGSVGIAGAGATLTYADGTNTNTTTADSSGNYSLYVPSGWIGSVTPSLTGYTFSPVNKDYLNVTSNQTQDYTATAAAASTDATLKAASTVKGQTVTSLGTPNSTLGSETAGAVTITAAKAADTTNATTFVTLFDKNNTNATVKVVKYASGTTDLSGFAGATAYANEAITDGDFFIVKVTAQDTTTVNYYKVVVTVTPADSTPSGGGSSSGSSNNNGAAVIVNGESKTAGTSQTTTDSSGQTTTTVTVDTGKLQTILDSQSSGATVTIPVTGNPNVAAGTLTGAMVKSMENKDATLVVQTDSGTYTLPASEINIDAVSQQLGTSVTLSDIRVTVSISEPPASMTQVIENAAQDGGFTIMVPAVDYTISCTHGSQTVNVSSFNAYVERTIAIPDGVDPAKITTGIVVDSDGTVHHVPTRITLIGGKYFAVINSLTNSTYSVVWNPVEFSDVTNHWAKAAINDMGSRMVVTGVGNNNYDPDRNMTRAEFAAIIIRALGLEPGTGESGFGDVAAADWYGGYIKTAASYGIIKGYDNGSFGPNDTITREQAMAMIARAMKITGLKVTLTDNEISTLIGTYMDGASASDYAKDGIAACLKTGITSGTSATTISPKADITRAEVAVMVQRLLQKSELI